VFTSLLSGDVSLEVYLPYLEEDAKLSGMASFLLKQYRDKILAGKNVSEVGACVEGRLWMDRMRWCVLDVLEQGSWRFAGCAGEGSS
jgi:hypothetical protein